MHQATHAHAVARDALTAARTRLVAQLTSSARASLDAIHADAAHGCSDGGASKGSTGGPPASGGPVTQDLPRAQLLGTFEEAGGLGDATQHVTPGGCTGDGMDAAEQDVRGDAVDDGQHVHAPPMECIPEECMHPEEHPAIAADKTSAMDEAGPLSATSQDDWDMSGGGNRWPHASAPPHVGPVVGPTAVGPASAPLPLGEESRDVTDDRSLPPSSQDQHGLHPYDA